MPEEWKAVDTAPTDTLIRVQYADGHEADAVRRGVTGGWIVTSDRDLRGQRPALWKPKEEPE